MERSILFINEVIWQTSQSEKSGVMTDTVGGADGVDDGDDDGGDGVDDGDDDGVAGDDGGDVR